MNYILELAYKNISRNRRRTALTMVGIILAVAFLIFMNSILGGLINQVLDGAVQVSGHVVIQSSEFTRKERMLPLDKGIGDLEGLYNVLKEIKEIKIAAPRINFGGMFVKNEESYMALATAVIPTLEKDFLKLENNIVAGTYFTGLTNEAIIGLEIAKKLELNPGDYALFVTKNSLDSIAAKKLRITGIADFNVSDRNRMFYIDIESAYSLLKIENNPQRVILILNSLNDSQKVKNTLLKSEFIKNNKLDVFKADETGIFQTIFPLLMWIFRFMMMLFLLAAMIVIANTMTMAVLERTGEIGVLQAMGMKKEKIILSIILESALMGISGSLIGALIAGPYSFYLKREGILLGESITKGAPITIKSVLYPDATAGLVLLFVGFGILISVIAGAFPAVMKIRNMNVAEAIRSKNV